VQGKAPGAAAVWWVPGGEVLQPGVPEAALEGAPRTVQEAASCCFCCLQVIGGCIRELLLLHVEGVWAGQGRMVALACLSAYAWALFTALEM
jgi:hypothetical protein